MDGFLAADGGLGRRDGSVYVTDQMTRLSVFGPDGTLRGRCRPVPALPRSVWADSTGDLYLAEGAVDEVFKLVLMAEARTT